MKCAGSVVKETCSGFIKFNCAGKKKSAVQASMNV
jgi:hypothetical protein